MPLGLLVPKNCKDCFGDIKTTVCKRCNVFHQVNSYWMRIVIHLNDDKIFSVISRLPFLNAAMSFIRSTPTGCVLSYISMMIRFFGFFGDIKTTVCKPSTVFHQVNSYWMRIVIHFKAVKTLNLHVGIFSII